MSYASISSCLGALRWIRRRLQAVHAALILILGLFPDLLAGCQPTVNAFRQWLGVELVLPRLREIAQVQLLRLPPPPGQAQSAAVERWVTFREYWRVKKREC
jgi:hypothetical protein